MAGVAPERLAQAKEILARLIAFPTVSAASNLELIDWCRARLEGLGASSLLSHDATGTKANLFASLGPAGAGGIVLSGHTDVVPVEGQAWTSDPFTAVEREGRIYGRGACDMKGFIACVLAMAPRFAAGPLARPLHIALTYDEEVGCLGAGVMLAAIREAGLRPALCVIGEPTEMCIVEGHKGCCEYTTRFSGLAGHGSDPEAGVSAVEYAVRYGARLLELREALKARAPAGSRFAPPWTTVHLGRLAGGIAHNVIADQAALEWEMRPVTPADGTFVKAEIGAYVHAVLLPRMRAVHPEAAIETEVVGEVPGLDPANAAEAAALVAELTGSNAREVVSFGTEAGIYQQHGISTVVCGPGSIREAHKADEFVAVDELVRCLEMLERLAARLAA